MYLLESYCQPSKCFYDRFFHNTYIILPNTHFIFPHDFTDLLYWYSMTSTTWSLQCQMITPHPHPHLIFPLFPAVVMGLTPLAISTTVCLGFYISCVCRCVDVYLCFRGLPEDNLFIPLISQLHAASEIALPDDFL